MLSSPVDNEVVVTKLLSARLSSPSGVDKDLDKNFLSGDNRLAGNEKKNHNGRCHKNIVKLLSLIWCLQNIITAC